MMNNNLEPFGRYVRLDRTDNRPTNPIVNLAFIP